MSEQLFLIVIVFLAIIMVAMMVIIVLLFLKLNQKNPSAEVIPEPAAVRDDKSAKIKISSDPTLQMCINHPDVPAHALCAISQEPICESCVREDDGIIFGLDHFRTYLESKWVEIESVRATADQTEASAHLFAFKYNKWKSGQTPSFVTTHYRIDVESDEIESLIKLYVREEEKDQLRIELTQFKTNHHLKT